MTALITSHEAERFRGIINRRLGLYFDDTRLGFLSEIVARRALVAGGSSESYLAQLDGDWTAAESAALAQELTVGETYFFRNLDQFRALAEICIPERMRVQSVTRRLRILSAGCSTGEEPYSLAIVAREQVPDPGWDVSVLGIDLNPASLAKADKARYSAWALRGTTQEAQQRWFRASGQDAVLDAAVRAAVRFEQRNLTLDDPGFWRPGTYDIIFCRNVLMYFSPDCARAVVDRLARSLAPGGYMFLGHAETLRGLSSDFHLCHTHGTFYYQRREQLEPQSAAARAPSWSGASSAPAPTPAAGPTAIVDGTESWVDAIKRASNRIHELTAASQRLATAQPGVAAPDRRSRLGHVQELLRQERFADALELMQALGSESIRDPDALLLHAVLLVHCARPQEAEGFCRMLLELDEFNAGAHYVLALCREAAGDPRSAIDHDQSAAYLDHTFAMPRLHQGLLAKRLGDHEVAARELGQALVLLQREDPSRLLLFGGGFGRQALIALCEAKLAGSGRPT